MTITFTLGNLGTLREYLVASAVDFAGLEAQRDRAAARVRELKTSYEPLDATYQKAYALHSAKRWELARAQTDGLKAAVQAIVNCLPSRVFLEAGCWNERECQNFVKLFLPDLAPYTNQQESPDLYCPEAVVVIALIKKLKDELESIPEPDDRERSKVGNELRAAQTIFAEAENAWVAAKERLAKTKLKLPNNIEKVSVSLLKEVAAVEPEDWPVDGGEDLSLSTEAAIIRGEVPCDCDCDEGFTFLCWNEQEPKVALLLNDQVRHPLCAARAHFLAKANKAIFDGAVEENLTDHRLHSLQPWPFSPVPVEAQKEPIDFLKNLRMPSNGRLWRGWLLTGPAGSSKSTLASAVVIDLLTLRMAERNGWGDSRGRFDWLNYWHIEVPRWIRDQETWETRDFEDRPPSKPYPMLQDIEEATKRTGLPPILLIEEIDKFKATPNRLQNLYKLVSAAYKNRGTIITTSNLPASELGKLLGDPIYRRLIGANDNPVDFPKPWDFWKLQNKGTGKSKTQAAVKASPRAQ